MKKIRNILKIVENRTKFDGFGVIQHVDYIKNSIEVKVEEKCLQRTESLTQEL